MTRTLGIKALCISFIILCGTICFNITSVNAQDCTFTLSRTSITIPAIGAGGTSEPRGKVDPGYPVSITASKGSCPWAATSSVSWITPSPASGTGSGRTNLTVAPNTSGSQRTGTIQIGGQTLTVTQGAATQSTCSIAISPVNKTFDPKDGKGTIAVTTDAGCSWTASTKENWIHITSEASSKGKGTVQYTVDQNQGAQRTGTIMVADKTVTVSQKGSKSQKSDTKKPIRK